MWSANFKFPQSGKVRVVEYNPNSTVGQFNRDLTEEYKDKGYVNLKLMWYGKVVEPDVLMRDLELQKDTAHMVDDRPEFYVVSDAELLLAAENINRKFVVKDHVVVRVAPGVFSTGYIVLTRPSHVQVEIHEYENTHTENVEFQDIIGNTSSHLYDFAPVEIENKLVPVGGQHIIVYKITFPDGNVLPVDLYSIYSISQLISRIQQLYPEYTYTRPTLMYRTKEMEYGAIVSTIPTKSFHIEGATPGGYMVTNDALLDSIKSTDRNFMAADKIIVRITPGKFKFADVISKHDNYIRSLVLDVHNDYEADVVYEDVMGLAN